MLVRYAGRAYNDNCAVVCSLYAQNVVSKTGYIMSDDKKKVNSKL
jgi:hypothetical protein